MVGLENTYFILQIAAGLAAMIAVPWGAFAFYWGYKAHVRGEQTNVRETRAAVRAELQLHGGKVFCGPEAFQANHVNMGQ